MADASAIRAGQAFIEIYADFSKLGPALDAARQRIQMWGMQIQKIGASFTAIGNKLIFATAAMESPMVLSIRSFTSQGSEWKRLSLIIGDTVENLSAIGFAAKQSNVDTQELMHSLSLMERFLGVAGGIGVIPHAGSHAGSGGSRGAGGGSGGSRGAGGGSGGTGIHAMGRAPGMAIGGGEGGEDPVEHMVVQQEVLKQLGLTLDQLQGRLPTEQFLMLANAIHALQDPAERAAVAMKVFGVMGGGTGLLPFIEQTRMAIQAQMDFGKAIGAVWTTQEAEQADRLRQAWVSFTAILSATGREIGATLAPALTKLLTVVGNYLITFNKWLPQHRELIILWAKAAGGALAAGAAFVIAGKSIQLFGGAVSGFSGLIGLVGSSIGIVKSMVVNLVPLLTNPWVLLGIAVAGAAAYVAYSAGAFDGDLGIIKNAFSDMKVVAVSSMKGITDALGAGDFALAAKVLWAGLAVEWQIGVNALDEIWQNFKTHFLIVMNELASGFLVGIKVMVGGVEKLYTKLEAFFASGILKVWLDQDASAERGILGNLQRRLAAAKAGNPADPNDTVKDLSKRIAVQKAMVDQSEKAASGLGQRTLSPQFNAKIDAIDKEVNQYAQDMKDILAANNKEAWTAGQDALAKGRIDLENARRDLSALVIKAGKEKHQSDKDKLPTGPGAKPLPGPPGTPTLAGFGPQGRSEGRSEGTFNFRAASFLGGASGGASHAERMVKATEDTAKNTAVLKQWKDPRGPNSGDAGNLNMNFA